MLQFSIFCVLLVNDLFLFILQVRIQVWLLLWARVRTATTISTSDHKSTKAIQKVIFIRNCFLFCYLQCSLHVNYFILYFFFSFGVCDRHFLILVCHSSGLTSDSETDFPSSSFGITSSLRQGTSQSDFSSIFGSDEVNSSAMSNSSIPGPSDERFRCRRVLGQPPKKKQCIANFSYN